MNAVDGSDHFNQISVELPPSLLSIVLDTNPQAWAHLADVLPLSKAIANLLVFINAHLAFNNSNKVAIIASHVHCAEFLYPTAQTTSSSNAIQNDSDHDVEMANSQTNGHASNGSHAFANDDANFYRPFAAISAALSQSLISLLRSPLPPSPHPRAASTTSLAGALTLALTHMNKTSVLLAPLPTQSSTANHASATVPPSGADLTGASTLKSRILVLSASPASPAQYIPLMNTIFAAQRLHIPIDVLALTPLSSPFLQQAADATHGIYLPLQHPHGFLQTLLQAYLPSPPSRALLIPPTQIDVDFRAACFCHRKVVNVGFVCSVCLSIFCEPPEGSLCLTCGTHLKLSEYGGTPVVVAQRKRKKKRVREEGKGEGGTPTPQ